MLIEIVQYAASWPATPAVFRRHLGEAVGLWSRGRRQARVWADHTRRTRATIENAMPAPSSRRTVAVLGSGPLFDVPLQALAAAFERVILIDQAHLAATRARVRNHRNVTLTWRDLSAPEPLAFLGEIPDLDWVISVNLLSQLGVAAAEGDERRLIDAHIKALRALPCRVTLVTDTDYRILSRNGELIEELDLLYGHILPSPVEQWSWTVAPFGEEERNSRRIHTVAAYPDLLAAVIKPT